MIVKLNHFRIYDKSDNNQNTHAYKFKTQKMFINHQKHNTRHIKTNKEGVFK